jgi:hypothetical protein
MPSKSAQAIEIGLVREPTRDIVNMRSLKNTTNNNQLPCKGEILMVPNMKLALKPLKTPIPHRYWRQTNPKRNTQILNNDPGVNIRPCCKNPIWW